MTTPERIDYLVKTLAFDSGKVFAQKCGVPETSLSKWRNGARTPSHAALEKILATYPSVRREWLYDGTGDPVETHRIQLTPGEAADVAARLERLEKMIGDVVEILRDIRDGR